MTLAAQTLAPAAALGPVGWLAAAGFLTGFAFETIADLQKFNFKSANPDKCDPSCRFARETSVIRIVITFQRPIGAT